MPLGRNKLLSHRRGLNVIPRWSYTWPGHSFSKTESKDKSLNEDGSLLPLLPVRGDGEIGQLLLLGTCFQLWLQNSSFNPFSLLATTCLPVQRLEQERRWAVGNHSRFAVLGSLLPCAHACSSSLSMLSPMMGQEANAELCKWLICSTALQPCISSDAVQACTQGRDF